MGADHIKDITVCRNSGLKRTNMHTALLWK